MIPVAAACSRAMSLPEPQPMACVPEQRPAWQEGETPDQNPALPPQAPQSQLPLHSSLLGQGRIHSGQSVQAPSCARPQGTLGHVWGHLWSS